MSMIKPSKTIEKLESGKRVVIAALGDSLTQGWMVRKGFLDYLREMLLHRYPYSSLAILNRGIPGDTADYGLQRLHPDILGSCPDCIFVQYALNDAFQGYPAWQFKETIRGIIDEIRAAGNADVVLITSIFLEDPRDYGHILSYYSHLEDLAAEYRLPVARVHAHWQKAIAAGVDFGRLVQSDLVHPTEEGYRYMAEAVMELFR
jgi:acyl-CoA thioesterase I